MTAISEIDTTAIQAGQVVVPCRDLAATLSFFVDRLGFKIETIFPADDPRVAVVFGYGVTLRLQRDAAVREPVNAATLRLVSSDPAIGGGMDFTAPNGMTVSLLPPQPGYHLPDGHQSFVFTPGGDADWGVGRAGMQYRDLIPDRLGGRFIASHIRIPDGGPVPDYVHFHKVRFQMIFCYKGWVRLVYEDQGEPFIMKAGDCVLQPPEIRHRVLECSDAFEVVEIGCPAEHPTMVEHGFDLPTPSVRADRDFSGQCFVFHQADGAAWAPWRMAGFSERAFGMDSATQGLAEARVVRADAPGTHAGLGTHDGEFQFVFVMAGGANLSRDGASHEVLKPCDSFVIPAGEAFRFEDVSDGFEFLEVTLPGVLPVCS